MKNYFVRPAMMILVMLLLTSACSPSQATPPFTNISTPLPTSTRLRTETPSPTPSPRAVEAADIIFYNGRLITMEADPSFAEAIALRGGSIQAVGTNQGVLALQGPETLIIDLQGRTLMPGFIDGHTHLLTFYGRMERTLDDAQEIALAHGYTTVSEMWANEDVVESFFQAEREGMLRMRVNLYPSYNDGILDASRRRVLLETWYPAHPPILDPQRLVRIPGIKIFVDGDNASRERGCWALTDPFLPGAGVLNRGVCGTTQGDLYWEQDELNRVVREAQDSGYRVAFHAMGDRAIETALDAIEYALDGKSNAIYRHQIEHNSMARPDLLTRYQSLGVAATVRGNADVCDLSGLEPAFGPERKAWYVDRYELPNLGIHAILETDFGWTIDPNERFDQRTLDPFMHLYGLVTHRYATSDDASCAPDPLAASKVISVERALQMMTTEGAWAVSMEDHIGSLKVGKYADLIVLTGDPLTVDPGDLKDLSVLMTMVGGKVEYCAEGQSALCSGNPGSASAGDADLPTSGNLAYNRKVTASSSRQSPSEMAVDGDETTFWGAGDFAPQWIEVDLGAPATLTEVRLRVGQSPDGDTRHRILAGKTKDDLSEVHQFEQFTRDGEWLVFTPTLPLESVQFIRVETLASPSWVAWSEIQVFGTR